MVEKYGKKSNWNGYSYREEMEGEAILNLSQNVLKFNEAKSDNPHAYISMCMKTTFIRELRKQHKQAHIKDELMMMEGLTPSHGRQLDHQLASRER
jgi:DNA-directed RNA polymerase specialized sigma24 family protein